MKLSEIINYLTNILNTDGNIEVYEALHEYGSVEISDESIKKLIKFEPTIFIN